MNVIGVVSEELNNEPAQNQGIANASIIGNDKQKLSDANRISTSHGPVL